MTICTPEQRRRIAADSSGRTIESMEWEGDGGYWVMSFADGTELSLRLMAELDDAGVLTADERRVLALSGELAGLVRRIIGDGPQAANDWAEAAAAIHVLQRMVAAQAAARAYPHLYRPLGG